MPRMEPRVVRRLENCSATDTIAAIHVNHRDESMGMGKMSLTKETRMSSHICTFQHLRYSPKCTHQTLYELKRSLCALAESIR